MGLPKIKKWEILDPDRNMFQGFLGCNITYSFSLESLPLPQFNARRKSERQRHLFDTTTHLLGFSKYHEFRDSWKALFQPISGRRIAPGTRSEGWRRLQRAENILSKLCRRVPSRPNSSRTRREWHRRCVYPRWVNGMCMQTCCDMHIQL